jgi:hypothetical protein
LFLGLLLDRFAEMILSAQKAKSCLNVSSKSCMQVWKRKTLQHLKSIMPIVFDQINAFARPLYGFQNSSIET